MITSKLFSYTPLFEDINILKKVKSVLAPKYSKEQAEQLAKDAAQKAKDIAPFVVQMTKGYRGNDADNITKLFLKAGINGELKFSEDFTIFKSFVDAFFKHKVKGFNWDTGTYAELKKKVVPYLQREMQTGGSSKDVERDVLKKESTIIFENSEWLVTIPKTQRASCILGRGSSWCTAVDPEKHRNMFDTYNRDGELIIFKNKRNEKEMYQIHVESESIMDIYDNHVNVSELVEIVGPEVDKKVANYLLAHHGERPIKTMDFEDALRMCVTDGGRGDEVSHEFIMKACSEDSFDVISGWDFPYREPKDILDEFNAKQEEKLQNICYEILDEAGVELDAESEESLEELLDMYPTELDGVINALQHAYMMAEESATADEAVRDITNQVSSILSEHLVPVKGKKELSWREVKGWELASTQYAIARKAEPGFTIEDYFDVEEEEFDLQGVIQPRSGWQEFSSETFWELFPDQLYEETKKDFK